MSEVTALYWENDTLFLLDQNQLPERVEYRAFTSPQAVAQAIKDMTVRGAPAIGVAAAFGVVLGAKRLLTEGQALEQAMPEVFALLSATRPTAVNLFWALERMRRKWEACKRLDPPAVVAALEEEARAIYEQEREANRRLAELGSTLVPLGARILTHCNAGALATVGYGTALGVIRAAHLDGKVKMVYADETRPRLQGARLTAWELGVLGVPVTVICDAMAPYLMKLGKVDLVIVGADRIAGNGDVANKIGTYGLALAARYHGIPFYVAAPTSTIDPNLSSGEEIPIEERPSEEVYLWGGRRVIPESANVYNPAFDVTPSALVSAIITEKGIAWPPFEISLRRLRD